MLALKIDYKLRLKHILPLANQKSHCLFLKNHLYPIPDQYALNKLKIPLLRFEVFPPKFYSFVFLNVDQYIFLHLIQFQIQYYKIPYKKMKSNSFRCMDNLKEVIVYSTRPIDQEYAISFLGHEGSNINRFSSQQPRNAQNIEKMYNSGIFGGLPNYEDSVYENQ